MKGICGSGHVSIANIRWKTIRNVDVVQNQKASMELWVRRGGKKPVPGLSFTIVSRRIREHGSAETRMLRTASAALRSGSAQFLKE